MFKYIANKNVKISSIYGSINLMEGNEYPSYLYKKFPNHFIIEHIPDPVVVQPKEEIIEDLQNETNNEIVIPKNQFKKEKRNN